MMKRKMTLGLISAALAMAMPVNSLAATSSACFRGINLAGAEFGNLQGVFGEGYIYPSLETVTYFAGKGFNTVRLPFLWERLQPKLNSDFDPAELSRLKETVATIGSFNQTVILDPHNYARYFEKLIGTEEVPVSAFVDFWQRLAKEFEGDRHVVFGLMNEPFDISSTDWRDVANEAIAGIREVGADNLILVPGTSWTGAHSWFGDWYGGANAEVLLSIKDPANNYAFELHQYFDDDFSGTLNNCSRAADAVDAIREVGEWLKETGQRGFLGEFGVPGTPECTAVLTEVVKLLDEDKTSWIGWTYWAAGDWWPETEELNIQPTKNGDRPQLSGLAPVLNDFVGAADGCPGLERP
ncbi:Cellulase family 5 [Rhizobium sp. RU33A]|uniref:glycoside hydrolase family 5 protein n=1 Tax=Rhizobium sp. RU33A TaxID=1907413 RepID=UPI0009545BE0|nr:glycoside hydrolase family 5 protein [Rhizobium sp. RU33A]SIR03393.1 Cellulase family 5 [Rhizobium sp. RU33A]